MYRFISNVWTFILICIIFFVLSCKEENKNVVPNVDVNLWLHIPTELSSLGVGSSLDRDGEGAGGIVIYRLSANEYAAYDRTCTFNPLEGCAVNSAGAVSECPCCSTKFILLDGHVVSGLAKLPLKEYQTAISGDMLHIYNPDF